MNQDVKQEQQKTALRELSDWQLMRVRNALRAYHCYERREEDGKYFNWKDVREAIAVYTGYEIGGTSKSGPKHGAERLRQFVQGAEDKKGGWKYPVPKPDVLEAIVNFVTHEELDLLNEDELEEHIPGAQAALRLLEYFDDGSETARLTPPKKLQGVYNHYKSTIEGVVSTQLTLQRPNENGLIEVVELREYFSIQYCIVYKEWGEEKRRQFRSAHTVHSGWAILTPEDNLMFFLKNTDNRRNRHYYTLAAATSIWEEADSYDILALVEQEFPLDLDINFLNVEKWANSNLPDKVMMFYKHRTKEEGKSKSQKTQRENRKRPYNVVRLRE